MTTRQTAIHIRPPLHRTWSPSTLGAHGQGRGGRGAEGNRGVARVEGGEPVQDAGVCERGAGVGGADGAAGNAHRGGTAGRHQGHRQGAGGKNHGAGGDGGAGILRHAQGIHPAGLDRDAGHHGHGAEEGEGGAREARHQDGETTGECLQKGQGGGAGWIRAEERGEDSRGD